MISDSAIKNTNVICDLLQMLDRLRLMVPFSPRWVTGGSSFCTARHGMEQGHKGLLVGLLDLGVPLGARAVAATVKQFSNADSVVTFTDWEIDRVYHPFESLPSSFTPLAFKVYHEGNHWPYIELKASPAKLLQGHNVFGPVDIALGAAEMLTTLQFAYPKLFAALEVESAQVWELDCTFSARLSTEMQAVQVIRALQHVSNGQTKSRGAEYASTVYWGSKSSRLKRLKAYLKFEEFQQQLKEVSLKSASGDESAKRVLCVMSDLRLQDWCKNLIRFESTICKRYLERRGFPVFLSELIKLQRELASAGRCFVSELWQESTKEIFAAFEGQTMRVTDDESVLNALKQVHFSYTPKGNISYAKANKLYLFYVALRDHGYLDLQSKMDRATFWRHIKSLQAAGFSKAFLQNLHGESQANVLPLLRFVSVDFGAQLPDWYVEPVSQFVQAA